MADIRQMQELYLLRNKIQTEIKTMTNTTNPNLIANYNQKLTHLKKQLVMIEDHINFYPLVCWLSGKDISSNEILNSTPQL